LRSGVPRIGKGKDVRRVDTPEVLDRLREARDLYYRLVLVVGPSGSGKTKLLRSVACATGVPVINLNLELSRRLLDVPSHQRPLHVTEKLDEIMTAAGHDLVLLDNTELLFDADLRLLPLEVLQSLSRNRTILATWNGVLVGNSLRYAVPGHPDYRECSATDVLCVNLHHEESTGSRERG
jgi:hypothetical protein